MKKTVTRDLTDEKEANQSRNKTALIGVFSMNFILAIAYLVELVKGTRTPASYAIVAAGALIPNFVGFLLYQRKKDSMAIRYILSVGFAFLYAYILFTTTTNLAFCYIIVIYVILAVYVDRKISVGLGTYGVLVNVAVAVNKAMNDLLTAEQITETEIILACLVLSCVFTLMAHSQISKINQANIDKADLEKNQSEGLLRTILGVSEQITENIRKASTETEALNLSIELTKTSMERLTQGADHMSVAIKSQQKNTEQISKDILQAGEVTDFIMNDMSDAEAELNKGKEVMVNLIHQVETSERASRVVAKEMEGLRLYANKMTGILELITNVASQTALLSLNASIEAARAGEAGRGFNVVAREIASLATQTSSATDEINKLIDNITNALTEVADSVEGLLESNTKQNAYVGETVENFEHIHTSTQNVFLRMEALKKKVDAISGANRIISESVYNVSEVTGEVKGGAYETFEGSKQNLKSISNVSDIMEELKQSVIRLRKAKRE